MGRRRAVVVAVAAAASWLLLGGTALADDCSSPLDCSNTAWTVGGGAAVAGGIIAAAAAAGVLGPPKVDEVAAARIPEEDRERIIEDCRKELEPHRARVSAAFLRCAELAGALAGAANRAGASEVVAEELENRAEALVLAQRRGDRDWERILRDPSLRPRPSFDATFDLPADLTGAVGSHGVLAGVVQGGLGTVAGRRDTLRRAVDAAAAAAAGRGEPALTATQRMAAASRHAGRLRAAAAGARIVGSGLNVFGGVTSVAAIWNVDSTAEMARVTGIVTEQAAQARLATRRWLEWRAARRSDLERAKADYRREAEAYNRAIGTCPFVRVATDFDEELVRLDPGRDEGYSAREPVLERPAPAEPPEQGPSRCDDLHADLAAYEQDRAAFVARTDPSHARWRDEIQRWATRRADLRATIAAFETLRDTNRQAVERSRVNKIGATWAAGALPMFLAWAFPPVTVGIALATGAASLAAAVTSSSMSVDDAAAFLEGQYAQRVRHLRYLHGMADGEVGRLITLLGTDLRNLRTRHAHLVARYRQCSYRFGELGRPERPVAPPRRSTEGLTMQPPGTVRDLDHFGSAP